MAFQLYRVADRQLTEHWEVADFATLMRQLKPQTREPDFTTA